MEASNPLIKNRLGLNTLLKDSHYLVLCLFAFSLPFAININSILLILLLIVSIYIMVLGMPFEMAKKKYLLFAPILYFLLIILRGNYSLHLNETFKEITLLSSFLVFPVILIPFKISISRLKSLFFCFLLGILSVILVSYLDNITGYLQSGNSYIINDNGDREFIFYYRHLVKFFGLHPSYISLYVSTAIFYICIYYRLKKESLNVKELLYLTPLLLILMVFNIQLASRGGFIAFSITLILLIGLDLIINFKLIRFIKYLTILVAIIYAVSNFEYFKTRFKVAYNVYIVGGNSSKNHSANSRVYIWDSSINIINETPFFGHGTIEGINLLKKEYNRIGFEQGISQNLNTHNQWFKTTISFGCFGLIILLTVILFPIFYFRNVNMAYYLAFSSLVSINFVFENMLSRQKGVIYFSFFYSLNIAYLYYLKNYQKMR